MLAGTQANRSFTQDYESNSGVVDNIPAQPPSAASYIPPATELSRRPLDEFRCSHWKKPLTLSPLIGRCVQTSIAGQQQLANTLAKAALQFLECFPAISAYDQDSHVPHLLKKLFINDGDIEESHEEILDSLLQAHTESRLLQDHMYILLPLLLKTAPSERFLEVVKKHPSLLPYGEHLSPVQAHYYLLIDTIRDLMTAKGFDDKAIRKLISEFGGDNDFKNLMQVIEDLESSSPPTFKTDFEKSICILGNLMHLYRELEQAHRLEKEGVPTSSKWAPLSMSSVLVTSQIDDSDVRQKVKQGHKYTSAIAHGMCIPHFKLRSLLDEYPRWFGLEHYCTPNKLSTISPDHYLELMKSNAEVPQHSALVNIGLGDHVNAVKCETFFNRMLSRRRPHPPGPSFATVMRSKRKTSPKRLGTQKKATVESKYNLRSRRLALKADPL
ncbi:hypothetical protein [Sansalvadorimonas verongulae]|uniref:hypothetical protein n=1 Tax=Sansalvadorimonas verongulae TaxID=2172824 RepID=UPI0012BD6026|nr:hypothetical protein [Sansalvadorimonas verongulae]MTI13859.1 hypothetical protein [Sansalvadorimonas verongulae]